MGIYIPIEMPKLGECIVVYGDGDVWHDGKRIAKVGTAIELPPHGRLGDLDALMQTYEQLIEQNLVSPLSGTWVKLALENATPIISADPEWGCRN